MKDKLYQIYFSLPRQVWAVIILIVIALVHILAIFGTTLPEEVSFLDGWFTRVMLLWALTLTMMMLMWFIVIVYEWIVEKLPKDTRKKKDAEGTFSDYR